MLRMVQNAAIILLPESINSLNKGADEGCQDEIGISGIGKYGYAAGIIETWDSQGPRPIHDADDMC